MCGIAGEFVFDRGRPGNADWEGMAALMARRGPDSSGTWRDPNHCTLTFCRLSVIDLSPLGNQPMATRDGRHALVFNGELYNFPALKTELQLLGHEFQSESDSEVVLYALATWGISALERFNGMFALAFYDSQEKRLVLARDHAGIKPLYYLKSSDGVVFASQYDQLMSHPWGHHLPVCPGALGLYLRLAYIPAPHGLLGSTRMLEPGTCVQVVRNGDVQQNRYFQFPRYTRATLKGQEAMEAVDDAIDQAVGRQLISDVPVGAFLSGGIDSPLIASKIKGWQTGETHAFTIGTVDTLTDEIDDARRYAKSLGLTHTVERMTANQALDMLDPVIDSCQEPFGDYSIFPTMLVSRLAGKQFKVMLSGDGGDELFWGYPDRFGSLLRKTIGPGVPFRNRFRTSLYRLRDIGQISGASSAQAIGMAHRRSLSHVSESWLKRIFPSLPEWEEGYRAFHYSSRKTDWVAQQSRWTEMECHLPYVLMKVDRASMYHSLEVRVPLLDREVIAVATQVNWRDCLDLRTMEGKIPLRRSLARKVSHQTGGKRGFEVPMGTWLRTSLRERFQDAVLDQKEIFGLSMDRRELGALFQSHLNGERDHSRALWLLLSLFLWKERHYAGSSLRKFGR